VNGLIAEAASVARWLHRVAKTAGTDTFIEIVFENIKTPLAYRFE